jgi:hypothetical protein
MKTKPRFFPLLLLSFNVMLLTAFLWAQGTPAQPTAQMQAQLFHRNQKLVKVLVESGLGLADQNDPLHRANHCNVVMESITDEIALAADERQDDRVRELGDHLCKWLEDGFATNLTEACKEMREGSQSAMIFQSVLRRSRVLGGKLEDRRQRGVDNDGIRAVMLDVAFHRASIEKRIQYP